MGYLSFLSPYIIGVGLSFTPCIFPMIPIILAVIHGQHTTRFVSKALLSLTYILSSSLTYAVFGVMAVKGGTTLNIDMYQFPGSVIAMLLFWFLAAKQMGKFKFNFIAPLMDRLYAAQAKISGGGYGSAIVLGIFATIIVSPCMTAPVLGVLATVANTHSLLLGGLELFLLGLGLGTLPFIIGCIGHNPLKKFGHFTKYVNYLFAAGLFGYGTYIGLMSL